MIDMIPVSSSNVAAIGYDETDAQLYVRFHSGETYRYSGVPLETYEQLMSSGSKGRALNQLIKGSFPYSKV